MDQWRKERLDGLKLEQDATDYDPKNNYVGPKLFGKTIPFPNKLPSGASINWAAYNHDKEWAAEGSRTKKADLAFVARCVEASVLHTMDIGGDKFFVDLCYIWCVLYPSVRLGSILFAGRFK